MSPTQSAEQGLDPLHSSSDSSARNWTSSPLFSGTISNASSSNTTTGTGGVRVDRPIPLLHNPDKLHGNAKYDVQADEGVVDRRQLVVDKRSLDYIIKSGIAGGTAGCAAKTLIAPLDRVKILFQTRNPQFSRFAGSWNGLGGALNAIYSQRGIWGLFQGHSATLLRVFPYAAIKFVTYEQIRAVLIPARNYETSVRRMLSGSLAGVVSVFFTYPLEVIRVRLAFDTQPGRRRASLTDTVKSMVVEGQSHYKSRQSLRNGTGSLIGESINHASYLPFKGTLYAFYRGFTPTVIGMLPYAGVSFLTHDSIQDVLRTPSLRDYTVMDMGDQGLPPNYIEDEISDNNNKKKNNNHIYRRPQLKAWAQLLAGGLAGLCSQTASYPFEVIRRRMQVGGLNHADLKGDCGHMTISRTAAMIFKESGFRGFFVGLSIGYLKVTPMVACSFYVYERMKHTLKI